jgi:MFS family permease
MTPVQLTAPALVARPPIVTRALLLRLVTVAASTVGFFLPFAVLPAYAARSAGAPAAGATTAALLVTTVAVELAAPALLARVGYRWGLGLGLVTLGAPLLLLLPFTGTAAVLAVSALRGAGFAVTAVAGGALTAMLLPAERRGEGLGLIGLVSGLGALVTLPAGVWLAQTVGYRTVFVLTAVLAVLPVLTVPFLPAHPAAGAVDGGAAPRKPVGLRAGLLLWPAAVFAASAAGAGVLATFLPFAVGGAPDWVVPAALLAQSATAMLCKWIAGRVGDRRSHESLLVPGLVAAALGMAITSATHWSACVVAGAAVFGAGFGVLQNATLTLMYQRVRAAGFGTVSALWNAAYDGGMAAGPIAVGLLAPATGYPTALLSVAVLMACATVLVPRARTAPLRALTTGSTEAA